MHGILISVPPPKTRGAKSVTRKFLKDQLLYRGERELGFSLKIETKVVSVTGIKTNSKSQSKTGLIKLIHKSYPSSFLVVFVFGRLHIRWGRLCFGLVCIRISPTKHSLIVCNYISWFFWWGLFLFFFFLLFLAKVKSTRCFT